MKIDSEVACGKQHYCMYKYVLHPTFGKLLVSWTRKGREGVVGVGVGGGASEPSKAST